jgi:hypothetical protein
MSRPEKVQAALRLMGDPYASLSLFDEADEDTAVEPSFEKKLAYFKKLENPHAHSSIFGESDDNLWQAAAKRRANDSVVILERDLEEVLLLYKPFVARNEWTKLMDYKPTFLKRASETPEQTERVANRLQKLKFSLSPGEKVEFNRAPAVRLINELEKILG